jgi:hypothetical protein
MDADKLRLDGANARAMGHSVFDNPHFRSEAMPAATGESIEEWQQKCDAWYFGWVTEDAMRSTEPLTLSPPSIEAPEPHT